MPTGERANPEVKQLIERHNGCARKNTDAYRDRKNNLKLPPSGRPDYDFWFASRRGPRVSGSIEFKAVKYDFKRKRQPPFEFARLSPEQREWLTHGFPELPLDAWVDDHWFALQMGARVNSKECPRRMWLIPWRSWLFIEAEYTLDGDKSISYSVETTNRKARQKRGGAVEKLKRYELRWVQGGWLIPSQHPFAAQYRYSYYQAEPVKGVSLRG